MKITRIEVKDVNQFKDLDIDLTYPKGHAKEGQPLDRVCFIGQSGTGKTTLLKFIYGFSHKKEILKEYSLLKLIGKVHVTEKLGNWTIRNSIKQEGDKFLFSSDLKSTNNIGSLTKQQFDSAYQSNLDKIKTYLIYFPADMKYDNSALEIEKEPNAKIYDFSEDNINKVWNRLLEEIQKQQEKELVLTQKISSIAIEENGNIKKLQEAIDELKQIRDARSNPLVNLAINCLNPILRHFNLQVKTELDIKTKEDIGFIKIMDNHGNEIPNGLLSTGTKQIILSALPLYLLDLTNTIILYDEPERSLYPDMQKIIVDYYTSFSKDAQFFFATHSPIIASCFEPWEIVELKFEDGYVIQEKYFEGERHVDNYSIVPKYLTYDLMLSKVFDVKQPNSDERNMKITEMLTLKRQLEQMKKQNKTDAVDYKTTFNNYIAIGSKLFWDTNM